MIRAQPLAPEPGAPLCFDTASVRAGGYSGLVGVKGAKGHIAHIKATAELCAPGLASF